MQKGARSEGETRTEPEAHRDWWKIAAVLAAVFAALVAAPPVYWGYLCRSSGTWCEGSYLPPRIDDNARERAARRIASDHEGKSFSGLEVQEAGFWPFGSRIDVIAKFEDGSKTIIDTMPSGRGAVEIYNDPSRAFVGVLTTVGSDNVARLIAYFPKHDLTRRVFDFSAGPHNEYPVSLSNLSYVENERRIVFDLSGTHPWIAVNNNQEAKFSISSSVHNESIYGATVALNLSDTLHVKSVHTIDNEREFAVSEGAFEKCKDDIEGERTKADGDVFFCRRTQSSDLRHRVGSLSIFEWRNGALNEVAVNHCDLPYWIKDPKKQIVYVTCLHQALAKSSTWLSVYMRPFREITYFFDGDCRDISLFDIRSEAQHQLVFRLWTNCATISVNEKPFDIALPPSGELRAMYTLVTDDDGLPVSLEPR